MIMNRTDRIAYIERGIAAIARQLHTIPSRDEAGEMGVRAAENRVKSQLTQELRAKFSFSSGADQIRMLGVGASCTTSFAGLLNNWQGAAKRRVVKIKAGAA